MTRKIQTNDAFDSYCLPKSMGDKSVNRLQAITLMLQAGSKALQMFNFISFCFKLKGFKQLIFTHNIFTSWTSTPITVKTEI